MHLDGQQPTGNPRHPEQNCSTHQAGPCRPCVRPLMSIDLTELFGPASWGKPAHRQPNELSRNTSEYQYQFTPREATPGYPIVPLISIDLNKTKTFCHTTPGNPIIPLMNIELNVTTTVGRPATNSQIDIPQMPKNIEWKEIIPNVKEAAPPTQKTPKKSLKPYVRKPHPLHITLPNGKIIFKADGLWNFLRNFDYEYAPTDAKYLILGDSIIKRVANVHNTQVISYPGFTVSKLLTLIEYNMIKEIRGKDTVILHIGTNDICEIPPETLVEQTLTLTRTVHRYNSSCDIIVSHIIPRLIDFAATKDPIYKYHTLLLKYSKEPRGVGSFKTITTNNTFLSHSKPIEKLYKQEDLLHPSPLGDERLSQFLANKIAKLMTYRKRKRSDSKPPPTLIRRSLGAKRPYPKYHPPMKTPPL